MKEAHVIFLVTTPAVLLNKTFKTCESQIRIESYQSSRQNFYHLMKRNF